MIIAKQNLGNIIVLQVDVGTKLSMYNWDLIGQNVGSEKDFEEIGESLPDDSILVFISARKGVCAKNRIIYYLFCLESLNFDVERIETNSFKQFLSLKTQTKYNLISEKRLLNKISFEFEIRNCYVSS